MTRYGATIHTFWCDHGECFASYEAEGLAAEVWRDARGDGWRSTAGGRHFCPLHADRKAPISETEEAR